MGAVHFFAVALAVALAALLADDRRVQVLQGARWLRPSFYGAFPWQHAGDRGKRTDRESTGDRHSLLQCQGSCNIVAARYIALIIYSSSNLQLRTLQSRFDAHGAQASVVRSVGSGVRSLRVATLGPPPSKRIRHPLRRTSGVV